MQVVYDIITLIKGRRAALLQVPGDAPGLPGGGPDVVVSMVSVNIEEYKEHSQHTQRQLTTSGTP